MSLTIKENRSDFIVAPEGLHIARCYALIDLGQQENKHYANYSPKVLIGWELSDVRMKDGRPFVHFQRYTSSLNEKSKLRSLLESWRGKGFTPEELKGFNLKSILGAPCYLTLRHTIHAQTQKKWANVIGICRLPSAVQVPAMSNPLLYFDLDHYTESAYLALPENIRTKINLGDAPDKLPTATVHTTPETASPPDTASSLEALQEAEDAREAGAWNENVPF